MFSCEFCEIFKNNFFIEHLRATVSQELFLFFPAPLGTHYNLQLNIIQQYYFMVTILCNLFLYYYL